MVEFQTRRSSPLCRFVLAMSLALTVVLTIPVELRGQTIQGLSASGATVNGLTDTLPSSRSQSPAVYTQHNDNARTGQNPQETILTPQNVNMAQFGKLFSLPVDGQVYAQPLYVPNLSFGLKLVDPLSKLVDKNHNVVFVATQHDSVYAFDANGGSQKPLWVTSFIQPASGITTVPSSDVTCTDITPEIGITSTPVIDPASQTLYVVAATKENGIYFYRLHALDLTTGSEKDGGPIAISGSVPGTGDANDGTGNVPFNPVMQLNRPGLLLVSGTVYIAFGSHCDENPYHGWLFAYDAATLKQQAIFNTTPNGGQGAIWQAGGGIAADAAGNIYLATSNGTFDADTGGRDYANSVIKLALQNGSFQVLDYFAPADQSSISLRDKDFGSTNPILLPDQPQPPVHLAVLADKAGEFYLLDRDNLGKFNAATNQVVQYMPTVLPNEVLAPGAFWNGHAYFQPFDYYLMDFTLANGQFSETPMTGPQGFGFPGASPTISANGTNNAIVWVLQTDAFATQGPAVLHAYDASNISTEFYNSAQAGARDQAGPAVKFTVPSVVNGKVYAGTATSVDVFGLLR